MLHYPTSGLPITIQTLGKPDGHELFQKTQPCISMQQTHSNHFQEVFEPYPQVLLDTDAALTQLPNVTLSVKTADCLPVMIFHPKPVIAAIHAGRKGTEKRILQRTLEYLKTSYPQNQKIHIFFGPYICAQCYQIDKHTGAHYDLAQNNKLQVRKVFSETQADIWDSAECTQHQGSRYFSYRREGVGVPMNVSTIQLVDTNKNALQDSENV